MILYGSHKQMLAISQELLEFLGFESIEELREKTDDIADFFVNKPGYIYNFKNFSWIDYIIFNQLKKPKVILDLDDNEIEAELQITTLPSVKEDSNYYLVNLSPTSSLSNDAPTERFLEIENIPNILDENEKKQQIEKESFLEDLSEQKTSHLNIFENTEQFEDIDKTKSPEEDKFHQEDSADKKTLNINFDDIDIGYKEPLLEIEKNQNSASLADNSNEFLDISLDADITLDIEEEKSNSIATVEQLKKEDSQVYDLEKAAKELGLDESLIKELLEEFISQALELKPQIEEALKSEDAEKVHTLIHKIKGAAANLRIEKANDILASTTGENDLKKLEEITEKFYDFIEVFKQYINKKDDLDLTLNQDESNIEKNNLKTEEESFKNIDEPNTYIDIDTEISVTQHETKKETDRDKEILFAPYDPTTASKELGLSESIIIEFLKEYIKQNKEYKKELLKSLDNKNLDEIKKICHKLKGSASNLRIDNVVKYLDQILNELDSQNLEKIKESIQQCFEYLEYLEKKFDSFDDKLVHLDNTKDTQEKIDDISKEQITKAAAEIGLEIEIYDEFLKEFLQTIQTLLEKNDKEEFKKEAKKLKSIAENLRMEEIAKILNKVEKRDENFENEIEKLKNLVNNLKYNT